MESPQFILNYRNFAFAFLLVLWLYWLWTRRHYYAFAMRFPGDLGLPIIGVSLKVGHIDRLLVVTKLYLQGIHKTICVWLGLYPIVITADPEVIEKILTSPDCLEKGMPIYEPLHSLLRGGILTSQAKRWRFHRKNLSVIFKHKTMLSFFPIFNHGKNHMINDFNKIANKGEHFVQQTIINNISRVAFETTVDRKVVKADDEILKLTPSLVRTTKMIAMQMLSSTFNLHKLLRQLPMFRKERNSIAESIETLIKEKFYEKDKELNEKGSNDPKEDHIEEKPLIFVDQVYKLYKEKKFSWDDVICEGLTLVAASVETTANTIYSALVFLATNPTVQERAFQEIATVYKDKNAIVQYEHYERLPYLDRVIQETLRLAPAFPVIARQIVKPFELHNGHIVPPGVQVVLMIGQLHRRKDIWGPNAENFDPDHFLPENLANMHPCAFIPFSKGPRNCIGWHYAQLALKAMLIGLIRNFRFETDFKYEDVEIKFNVSSAFIKDPSLRIYSRS